jgi:hypothetical protein
MPAPTNLPEWASVTSDDPTTGVSNVIEPAGSKKQSGWMYNEKPPRQYLNWWQNLVYQWLTWFNSLLNQGVKTTDSPIFAGINADAATIPIIYTDTVTALTNVTTPAIVANTSVTTPEIIITGATGKSKRINEGVYGSKVNGAVSIVSNFINFQDYSGSVKISTNLEIPENNNTQFKIKYAGKYKVDFCLDVVTPSSLYHVLECHLYKNSSSIFTKAVSGDGNLNGGSYSLAFSIIISLDIQDVLSIYTPVASNIGSLFGASFNILMVGD